MRFLDYMSTGSGRAIRATVGLLFIAAGALLRGGWWTVAGFGLLPLATGLLNVCPISPLLGRSSRGNTCRLR